MANILVTGGAGYIGSHTSKAIAQCGDIPVTLDDLSTGNRWAAKFGPFIQGSCGDKELVTKVLRDYNVEGVIHFAASAYVGESVKHPDRYFQNNVVNTLALLDGMRNAGVAYFIFSSSCATYGVPLDVPVDESHPQVPMSPYGDTKLTCEKIVRAYGTAFGLHWGALRYFNAAGGDPDGEVGETHSPETHLIPNAIRAALGEVPALDLFGTDYPTPDGTAVRDYVHVLDLADAHRRALAHLWGGGDNLALNLGTGRGNSVLEIIRAVEEVSGLSVPVREQSRRAGDVPGLWAKNDLALSILDWQPRFVDVRETVEHAFRWAKQGWRPVKA